MLDTIEEQPVLDAAKGWSHSKALEKIINYGVDHMIYISCKLDKYDGIWRSCSGGVRG